MSKFLPTNGFKWISSNEFNVNKYTRNSSFCCFFVFDLDYSKELHELHNDYPLAPGKIEIERERLSNYQLRIADVYNIPVGNFKTLVSNSLNKKNECFIMTTYNFP